MRTCNTCQHLKRPDIDRRLAAGEPVAKLAHAYDLSVSSVQRHRANCLGLASSNEILKAAARGTAAIALLPAKEDFSSSFARLKTQIEDIERRGVAMRNDICTALLYFGPSRCPAVPVTC